MDRDGLWRLVEAYRDAWVAQDVDRLLELVTPDVVFHNYTAAERVETARQFGEHVAQIHARWPDTRFAERRIHFGDDLAVVEWTAAATRTDRRQIEWDGSDVIVLRDGRICANYVYSSSHSPRVLDVENTA
ncbi:MAG: nuclear transport factor 2 family protein [Solirubrobacteraceae bacterium]